MTENVVEVLGLRDVKSKFTGGANEGRE